ncbi:hypothetical protein ACQ4N7_30050 [Nodosilinea sp. AN01ver1]|uniref:hypothetical protein n=1 Tax=Nodosilinea sp. AN01ver1 TaxID=3423362 RepID=UPI003D320B8C
MKPEISEFSFGYAFTDEISRKLDGTLVEAPFFPSLIEEGELGFDVGFNFGIFLFIQFKLSDHMINRRAREAKAGIFTPPYYRFELRSRKYSKQHDSLLALESHGYLVYYVAPVFHDVDDLNNYYVNRQVAENSVFVPPSQIGMINDFDEHHVSFQAPNGDGYLLSEPRQIGSLRPISFFEREVISTMRERGRNGIDNDAQRVLLKTMVNVLIQTNQYGEEDFRVVAENDNLRPIQRVAYMARTFFNCETFIVRPQTS